MNANILWPYSLEQVLVRTRESVSIVGTSSDAPEAISRMDPTFVEVIATIPSRIANDDEGTIHASISPHWPEKYALLGDKGSVKIWTLTPAGESTNPLQEHLQISTVSNRRSVLVDDPWRSCAWGAHPNHLVVASRQNIRLLDCRVSKTDATLILIPTSLTFAFAFF